jgi:hypothetical protein
MQIHLALSQGRGYLDAWHRAVAFAHAGDARDSEPAIKFRNYGVCIHLELLLSD